MLKLEEIRKDTQVCGLESEDIVWLITVEQIGTDAFREDEKILE